MSLSSRDEVGAGHGEISSGAASLFVHLKGFLGNTLLLILKILHDLPILQYHNFQGIRYLGSCKIFSIHRRIDSYDLT